MVCVNDLPCGGWIIGPSVQGDSRINDGGGFSRRTLYSDDGDSVYRFRRSAVLKGINPTATSTELLDRAIIIKLERLSNEERRVGGGRSQLMRNFVRLGLV
jgi:hypothetical protein